MSLDQPTQSFSPVLGGVFPSISAFPDTRTCIKRSTDVEFGLGFSKVLHPNLCLTKLMLPPTFWWHFPKCGASPTHLGLLQVLMAVFGSALPLLCNASKSLISEDGWLLDVDHRPLVPRSYYTTITG